MTNGYTQCSRFYCWKQNKTKKRTRPVKIIHKLHTMISMFYGPHGNHALGVWARNHFVQGKKIQKKLTKYFFGKNNGSKQVKQKLATSVPWKLAFLLGFFNWMYGQILTTYGCDSWWFNKIAKKNYICLHWKSINNDGRRSRLTYFSSK